MPNRALQVQLNIIPTLRPFVEPLNEVTENQLSYFDFAMEFLSSKEKYFFAPFVANFVENIGWLALLASSLKSYISLKISMTPFACCKSTLTTCSLLELRERMASVIETLGSTCIRLIEASSLDGLGMILEGEIGSSP